MIRRKWRIGSLLSKNGPGTEAIIAACERGVTNGEVVLVVSDRMEALGLERARVRNIPTLVVSEGEIARETKLLANDFSEHLFSPKQLGALVGRSAGIIPSSITDVNERVAWIIKRFLAENFLLDMLIRSKIDFLLLDEFAWELSAFFMEQLETRIGDNCLVNIS